MLQIITAADHTSIMHERIDFNRIKQARRGTMAGFVGDLYSVLAHCHERAATIPYDGDRVIFFVQVYDMQRDHQIARAEFDSTLTYDGLTAYAQQVIINYWKARQIDATDQQR